MEKYKIIRCIFTMLISFYFSSFGFSQEFGNVTGKIVDKSNQGIPDIIVQLQSDELIRTRTDLDGYYKLKVPIGKQVIIIRFDNEEQHQEIDVEPGDNKIKKVTLNIRYFQGVDVSATQRKESINSLPIIDVHRIPGPQNSVERYISLTTAATSNN